MYLSHEHRGMTHEGFTMVAIKFASSLTVFLQES